VWVECQMVQSSPTCWSGLSPVGVNACVVGTEPEGEGQSQNVWGQGAHSFNELNQTTAAAAAAVATESTVAMRLLVL
jgi:hypothetical protein